MTGAMEGDVLGDACSLQPVLQGGACHTFGSLQVDAGTGIYTVQHMLGHKNVETTQIYANMADESKRESVNRITLKPKITPQLKVVGQG